MVAIPRPPQEGEETQGLEAPHKEASHFSSHPPDASTGRLPTFRPTPPEAVETPPAEPGACQRCGQRLLLNPDRTVCERCRLDALLTTPTERTGS
jgi:hypothetical protein